MTQYNYIHLQVDKDGKCKICQPAEVDDITEVFADLQVTSVEQFQDITSEDLKRLEDKLATRMPDKQDYVVK